MSPSHKVWIIIGFTLTATACQTTTGDPRTGGLFGWSEEKAKERQLDLQVRAASASVDSQEARALSVQLAQRRHADQRETQLVESRLTALTAENQRLEAQLVDLRKRNTAYSDRLTTMLRDLDTRRAGAAQFENTGESNEAQRARADMLNARNTKLHQAINLLLQR